MVEIPRPALIAHITTAPISLWSFLRGQVGFMRAKGLDVMAVSSPGEYLDKFAEREEIPVFPVEMPRRITPFGDTVAVLRLTRLLRRIRPDIVQGGTPKGGLLGMIAARLAGVPVRIYQMRGLPMMTASGYRRWLLRWSEKIACRLADRVFCVSHSIRAVTIQEGLCPPVKIAVMLGGSSNGVDATGRFDPASVDPSRSDALAAALGLDPAATVIGFVGRLVRDKGAVELAHAWGRIRDEYPDARLLLIGRFEAQDPVPDDVKRGLLDDPRVVWVDHVPDSAPYYPLMDLVVLPTYREGFPNVPLEAAAMELPVVATRIPGCADAVQDGVTGTLVPPRDADALANAIKMYLDDPELRRKHGTAGRERVLREFRQEDIWEAYYQEYVRLLREKGLPVPEPVETPEPAGVGSER
jgi:glycosyltransferase involved in cell wall biosynthesis